MRCPSQDWDRYYRDQEEQAEHEEYLETLPTVDQFCQLIGCGVTLRENLRAIDRHNLEHVWVVLAAGVRVYYHTDLEVSGDTRISRVGAGCIAWDGSDWETSWELEVTSETLETVVERVREEILDRFREYQADREE